MPLPRKIGYYFPYVVEGAPSVGFFVIGLTNDA